MPPPPKIGKANSRVRKTEIILQMKAKAESRADGACRVAGEIEEYLAGECHNTQPGIQRDERTSINKDAIRRTGKHRVGEHDFFEQAKSHEQQSPQKLACAQTRRPDKLRKKIAGPNNWPGNQLRKKRNGQDEIAQRPCRLQNAAINVERVRERMERVKGNADRQKNVEMRWLIDDADAREQPLKVLQQKVPVFKKPEHAQVHAHAANQPRAARTPTLSFRHLSSEPKIHCRRGEEQRGKRRVPSAIKNVTRDYEEIFPRVPGTYAPVGSDDDCKKDDEGKRIEKHDRRDCLSKSPADGQYILPHDFASRF